MLKNLIVNNIVLIDKLALAFEAGLCVFTGETGSGKSILLDALGLATGTRSNSRLLRTGETQGSVIAEFDISNNASCQELLAANDIPCYDGQLILRRIITHEGKSRAIANDIPIGQGLLDIIGDAVLEIHGQHEQRGLLNPAVHREILDEYGELTSLTAQLSTVYDQLKQVEEQIAQLTSQKAQAERERDYLEHVITELSALNIEVGEEELLSSKRAILMNKEKIAQAIQSARDEIAGGNGNRSLCSAIGTAQNILARNSAVAEHLQELLAKENPELQHDSSLASANFTATAETQTFTENSVNEPKPTNIFETIIDTLDRAAVELNEAESSLEGLLRELGYQNDNLEAIEERLFNIKDMARKFNCPADELPNFLLACEEKLNLLQNEEIVFGKLNEDQQRYFTQYQTLATQLTQARRQAAINLQQAVVVELAFLKMNNVRFEVEIQELPMEKRGRYGLNTIRFLAATNTGTPLDNIAKIASGGELSRFMLALKVALSKVKSVPTLIFDEIDAGIGGAVADAVGKRLKLLSKHLQILVVTHHPQVAAKANYHLCVAKTQAAETTTTNVQSLSPEAREQEIARMLAGENITQEAVANAKRLLAEGSVDVQF